MNSKKARQFHQVSRGWAGLVQVVDHDRCRWWGRTISGSTRDCDPLPQALYSINQKSSDLKRWEKLTEAPDLDTAYK